MLVSQDDGALLCSHWTQINTSSYGKGERVNTNLWNGLRLAMSIIFISIYLQSGATEIHLHLKLKGVALLWIFNQQLSNRIGGFYPKHKQKICLKASKRVGQIWWCNHLNV